MMKTMIASVLALLYAASLTMGGQFQFVIPARAPSLHFNYDMDKQPIIIILGSTPQNNADDKKIEYFYDELIVPDGYDPETTFINGISFNSGYFGIQTSSEHGRRILFSIWSQQQTQDPNEITKDNEVKVVRKGKGVKAEGFGKEGSGTHVYLKKEWKTGKKFQMLMRHRVDPKKKDHSIFTAWYTYDGGDWQLMAEMERYDGDIGSDFPNIDSFLENFDKPNGYLQRKGIFCNQWIRYSDGKWKELTKGKTSVQAWPNQAVEYDSDAGTIEVDGQECFYLKSGGTKNHTKNLQWAKFSRKPNKTKPKINFEKLP